MLFKKSFETEYPILTVSSGDEGLEILQNQDIFLVLADHQMPRMSGVDFLEQARKVSPKSVRAILSAYHDKELRTEAQQRAQIKEYLKKPWRRDEIRPFLDEARRLYQVEIEPATEPALFWGRLCQLLDKFGDTTDKRGAKRVYLSYVEPPLKRVVATIRRSAPEALSKAEECALRGDIQGLEANLLAYLNSANPNPHFLPEMVNFFPSKH